MPMPAKLALTMLVAIASPLQAQDRDMASLEPAAAEAQRQLHQSFANLHFEDFGPAPVTGPIYQALAGGRIIYFAPESGHLIFGAVYDKNGVNQTALAQDASARKRLAALDLNDALAIGPAEAPSVIEFTDPDCPYCQALERYWLAKATEGKSVRRLIYFVSGIHPGAAALAEHILCSPDREAMFKAVYGGSRPTSLRKCKAGAAKVARDSEAVRQMGIAGTPTLLVDGKLVSGFQQGELDAFLTSSKRPDTAQAP